MQAYRLHRLSVTDSTNREARGGRVGDVFAADYQTAGRGRLDHRWLAPAGVNVMFSVVLDVTGREPAAVATLPLAVGLAVLSALRPLVPQEGLRIKWPNDVLFDGRKVAGILCERSEAGVIAGVGINVNQESFPDELAPRATSLVRITGAHLDREAVLQSVLREIGVFHRVWQTRGFAALHPQFAAVDYLAGRRVTIRQTDDDPRPVTGLCAGVNADGTLQVADTPVFAGEAHVASC